MTAFDDMSHEEKLKHMDEVQRRYKELEAEKAAKKEPKMTEALKLVEDAAKTAAAASVPMAAPFPNLRTSLDKSEKPSDGKATYADILLIVVDATLAQVDPQTGRRKGTKIGEMDDDLDLRDILVAAKPGEPIVIPVKLMRKLRKMLAAHEFPIRSRCLSALGQHVGPPEGE